MDKRIRNLIAAVAVVTSSAVWAFGDSLTPATFNENVGIAWYSARGSDPLSPELVDLTVSRDQAADRGSGSGFARAVGVLPVIAETELHLKGGPSISGIGATVSVEIRYEATLEPMPWVPGPPEMVDFTFSASGWVTVDSNQPPGSTFARLTTPFGQFEARNYDAYGWYTGRFSFDVHRDLSALSGTKLPLVLYTWSHGEGRGSDYSFHSRTFLDPVIELAPAFVGRYRVAYSPGISSVPEVSSLWLLATGVVALFVLGGGRRG